MTAESMLGAIPHRGPDAHGTHVGRGVALGSARLAIIDLHGGDQPLRNETGDVALVCNGEIYNYRELARELKGRGHRFSSSSDSEVILHLYEEEGIGAVRRLNGMYAFAIHDERDGSVHIARDRFGVKPLFYAWDGRRLAFASEVRALIAAGLVTPRLDMSALAELLTFQNLAGEDTCLFDGVSVLPAGCSMRVDRDQLTIDRWFDPIPRPARISRDEAVSGIRERFAAAVERQLVSDVPVASYLSGGLDTGAITAVAAGALPNLTTFSTGFDVREAQGIEAGFDERSDARALAERFGTHHHELLLGAPDLELSLPRLVKALEEPRMSFSYPNYLTAGVASRWVKVVLSGVGGDELFGGYPWRYELATRDDFPDAYYGYWERLLTRDQLGAALTPSALAETDLDHPRRVFDGYLERVDDLPPLDRILYFESRTFLHGLLLVEDKVSMAHSLESRVPFLDDDLVDFALSIPGEMKLDRGRSKGLFRDAMVEVLPREVRERKKTGFTPPQAAWFRNAQAEYVERNLLTSRALERGVFREDFVRNAVEAHRARRSDNRLLLWTLLCVEWWQRIFIDGEYVT